MKSEKSKEEKILFQKLKIKEKRIAILKFVLKDNVPNGRENAY